MKQEERRPFYVKAFNLKIDDIIESKQMFILVFILKKKVETSLITYYICIIKMIVIYYKIISN